MLRREFLKNASASCLVPVDMPHLLEKEAVTGVVTGDWGKVGNDKGFVKSYTEFGKQIKEIIESERFGQKTKVSLETRGVITCNRMLHVDNELAVLANHRKQRPKDKMFRYEVAFRIYPDKELYEIGSIASKDIASRVGVGLDRMILLGDGISSPRGILNTNGIVDVDWNRETSVQNYGNLKDVACIENDHRDNTAFCGTETSYQRVRTIPIDSVCCGGVDDIPFEVAQEQHKRYWGLDPYYYEWMGYSYKIVEDATNENIVFGDFKKYDLILSPVRPYIRIMEVVKNRYIGIYSILYGGELTDTSAFAKTTNAPK